MAVNITKAEPQVQPIEMVVVESDYMADAYWVSVEPTANHDHFRFNWGPDGTRGERVAKFGVSGDDLIAFAESLITLAKQART